MSAQLDQEDDALAEGLRALATGRDVAELLEVQYKDLTFWLYRSPLADRYREFALAKRSGGERRILAPNTSLKILQQKLSRILYIVYRPRPCVHGFVFRKSVATNAKEHVRNRLLLN